MARISHSVLALLSLTLRAHPSSYYANSHPDTKAADDSYEWRLNSQTDSSSTETNHTWGSYEDSVELEYGSGDGRPKPNNSFEQKFYDAEIVDDVIRTYPSKCLKVTFKHGDLIPGQRLSLLEAWDQPNITFESDTNRSLHTIFLSCNSKHIPFSDESLPDGFLFDTGTEIAKWLIINIPANNISAGRSLYNYTPPSRQHFKQVVDRYTFLLYRQKFKIRDYWLPAPVNGDHYLPGEINQSYPFAQEYRLGDPIAANFFIMHW